MNSSSGSARDSGPCSVPPTWPAYRLQCRLVGWGKAGRVMRGLFQPRSASWSPEHPYATSTCHEQDAQRPATVKSSGSRSRMTRNWIPDHAKFAAIGSLLFTKLNDVGDGAQMMLAALHSWTLRSSHLVGDETRSCVHPGTVAAPLLRHEFDQRRRSKLFHDLAVRPSKSSTRMTPSRRPQGTSMSGNQSEPPDDPALQNCRSLPADVHVL